MLYEKIYLHENEEDVYFEMFCCDSSAEYAMNTRPAVLVCPGGGYGMCSDREGEPIARMFMAQGYNCAVLRYSVGAKAGSMMPKASRPLLEASKTMSLMRENAEKWNIDKDRIAVIGFSAGGHLAASLGTMWHDSSVYDNLDIEYESNKPNAMILCYAVLSFGEITHEGTRNNLLGKCKEDKALWEKYDTILQVSEKTPQTFLWHTFTDTAVPVENSLRFCEAMAKYKIPCEMHIFPHGGHGMSNCVRENSHVVDSYVGRWEDWCLKWLDKVFYGE